MKILIPKTVREYAAANHTGMWTLMYMFTGKGSATVEWNHQAEMWLELVKKWKAAYYDTSPRYLQQFVLRLEGKLRRGSFPKY